MTKLYKNRLLIIALIIAHFISISTSSAQSIVYEKGSNFYVVNDLGRNGYYKQKHIANLMGELAGLLKIGFIVAAGDTHHFNGVQSTQDPLWMTNYELIYSHPNLMCEWHPICGNHEYQGNTEALIDYSNISRRWVMPALYYSKEIPESANNSSLLLVLIDTTPLIDSYWTNERYKDVLKQDTTKQLEWIDKTLEESKAKYKIVIGHHPIYVSEKMRKTEESLVNKLEPILKRHNVDMYIAGHSHTFQHIKKQDSEIHYIVNGSGSSGRYPIEGSETVFCSSDEGFSVVSLSNGRLKMSFMNFEGKPIHQIELD